MTKAQILLKMAQLKRDYAKEDLRRMRELVRADADAPAAADQAQLNYDLAECEVALAELELTSPESN